MRLQGRPLSDAQIFAIADFLQIDPIGLVRPYHEVSTPEQEICYELAYAYQSYPRHDTVLRQGVRFLLQEGAKMWESAFSEHATLPQARGGVGRLEEGILYGQVAPGGFYENRFGSRLLDGIIMRPTTLRAVYHALGIGEAVFYAAIRGVTYPLSDAQIFSLAQMLGLPPLSLLLPYHGIEDVSPSPDAETKAMIGELRWVLKEYPRCDAVVREGIRALLRSQPAFPYWGTPRVGKYRFFRTRAKKKQGEETHTRTQRESRHPLA